MRHFVIVVIILISFTTVHSQDKGEVTEDEATIIVSSRTMQSSRSSGFLSNNNFTKLTATNDGTSADANINYAKKSWNLSFKASTPISKKGKHVKPLSIAGLANGSTLNIGVQKILWGKDIRWNVETFSAARKAIGKDTGDFKTKNLTQLEKAKFYEIADIDWGTNFFMGIDVGIGQQEFKYIIDPITFEDQESNKSEFSFSASLGLLGEWGIIAIRFTHQNSYQADDPIKYYIPVNSSGIQIEKELSPTAPKSTNYQKLRMEFLSIGKPKVKNGEIKRTPFRINPNFMLEFNNKLFAFEFPVYFLTSDNDRTNFNGGIFAGYVSDKRWTFNFDNKNINFGVFIGANFTNLFQ